MSGGKGSRDQVVRQETTIPSFLQPFIQQSASTGQNALSGLEQLLGQNLVQGFTPNQSTGLQLAGDIGRGAGGFIPTAQDTFLNAARGVGVDQFLPSSTFNTLSNPQSFLSNNALSSLTGLATNPISLDPTALNTLQRTAAGDFLAGGAGFDAAVGEAVRRATPAIGSVFGRTRGGIGSGLAQQAAAQTASDAFARQFANERANQLGASNTLASLGLQGNQQQLGALGLLGNIGQGQASLGLSGAGTLANLSNAERSRQLGAAGRLPNIGLAGSDILTRVGGIEQNQAQRELLGPVNQTQQLLALSSGVPGAFSPLFGNTQTTPLTSNPLQGVLGGALTASQLFPGAQIAAPVLGGIFGGLLS